MGKKMTTTNENHTEENPDDVESVEEEETGQIPNTLMEFTNVLQALQNQRNAAMMALLPPAVKRRIKALKKLQLEATNIEAKFFAEVHELECKYQSLYTPLYEKRNTIVNGNYEPTDEESQWPSDDEDDEMAKQIKEKAKIEEIKEDQQNKEQEPLAIACDVKGIPDFWLTIFKNVSLLSEMVQPHDEPILKHLIDIKAECRKQPMGFTLEFHFSPNEYFTNTVLTKDYEMKCVPDDDDPFSFEGPEIYKCTGCTINWNKGKNVTVKTVKKKQKHRSRGSVRTVTKVVQNDSFFNFFSPPTLPENTKDEEIDEDLRLLLTTDFEIGHYLRERVVPRAVLFYTGEGVDDEEEDYEEDEELDDEDEENDSDDGKENGKGDKPNENCKQQ